MKTLIVPDIHEKISTLNRLIVQAGRVDKTVFLGDWFDDWHSSPTSVLETIACLGCRMEEHPEDIFLWGNHDLPYAYRNLDELKCSGHFEWKYQYLGGLCWRGRFILRHEVNGWLLSHAGFHEGNLEVDYPAIQDCLDRGKVPAVLLAGRARGGSNRLGGCTWMDWDREFRPVAGVKQIVGHTQHHEPRYSIASDVCLDTGLKHYGIVEDGKLSVHEVI